MPLLTKSEVLFLLFLLNELLSLAKLSSRRLAVVVGTGHDFLVFVVVENLDCFGSGGIYYIL